MRAQLAVKISNAMDRKKNRENKTLSLVLPDEPFNHSNHWQL
jgi:hypothetical protein